MKATNVNKENNKKQIFNFSSPVNNIIKPDSYVVQKFD